MWEKYHKATRVILLTTEKGEYKRELKELDETARRLAFRHDLRVLRWKKR